MRYVGNIYRPPSEAYSLLVQVTIGCSHNKCTFCNMYKDKQFRVRNPQEVLEDLAWAREKYRRVDRIFLCDGDALCLSNRKLLEILEAATAFTPEAMGAFPQTSGISYTIDTKVPYEKGELYPASSYYAPANPGSRITIDSVGGRRFRMDDIYTIALVEYLAIGGDTYAGLCLPEAKLEYRGVGYLDVEALENYLTEELHGEIGMKYAASQERITIK